MESLGLDVRSTRKRKADRVPAKGRGTPCTQQGMIVGTVDFSRTQYEDRKLLAPTKGVLKDGATPDRDPVVAFQQATGMYAPIGDASCFQAMQGEIAIAAVNDNGITERNPLSNDCSLSVTTTVNGWDIRKDSMFAGVVRNARPLTSKDSKGTIAYVGTQTVMNTGPEEIFPGDEVYYSMTPYSVIENNVMRNVIEADEAGEPGHQGVLNEDGVLAAKFRPSTHPLRDNSIYALVRRGTMEIDNMIEAYMRKTAITVKRIPKEGTVRQLFNGWLIEIKKRFMDLAGELPLMEHFKIYLVSGFLQHCYMCSMNSVFTEGSETKDGVFLAFLKETHVFIHEEYFDKVSTKRGKYEEAITQRNTNISSSSAVLFRCVANDSAKLNKDVSAFIFKLERAKSETLCEIHNFVRRRLIGKCVRGNVTGAGIDIACGYTHK